MTARYPNLTALYEAQSAVGVRAANPRAKNQKAKAAPEPTPDAAASDEASPAAGRR